MSDNGFWSSIEGVANRITDIGHNFSWGTLAEAMKGIFFSEPKTYTEWMTWGDDKVCDVCAGNSGRYTEKDALIPDMPAHVLCRCYWEVYSEGEDVPED